MRTLRNPDSRMLRDPAVKTPKVRDGQASAFKRRNLTTSCRRLSSIICPDSGKIFRKADYREFTSSNMVRLNCFLRFSAVAIGI